MILKVIIAGFGGQGIILSGMILAYAAMMEGKEVSHFASYGAEMRGGTCNCSVIVSDEKISSPIISTPDIAIILNQPSKLKFETKCRDGGTIIFNNSLIKEEAIRKDLKAYYVDATNISTNIGNIRATNMVMLGSLVKATNIVKLESIIEALPKVLSARNLSLIDINIKALHEGYNSIII